MEMSEWTYRKCLDATKRLKEWSDKPDSFHIAQFLVQENMSHKELKKLCTLHPPLEHALEVSRSKILVNWMNRFEREDISVQTARFGWQCINTYDLDHLEMTKKRNASKFSKKTSVVGSNENIIDEQFLGDFQKVKLTGDAKKLYDESSGRTSKSSTPEGSVRSEG